MKNSAFHRLLRWKMILLPILTTSHYTFHSKRLGECTFWAWLAFVTPAPPNPTSITQLLLKLRSMVLLVLTSISLEYTPSIAVRAPRCWQPSHINLIGCQTFADFWTWKWIERAVNVPLYSAVQQYEYLLMNITTSIISSVLVPRAPYFQDSFCILEVRLRLKGIPKSSRQTGPDVTPRALKAGNFAHYARGR